MKLILIFLLYLFISIGGGMLMGYINEKYEIPVLINIIAVIFISSIGIIGGIFIYLY